jgi:uncharacterized integral membrane protein
MEWMILGAAMLATTVLMILVARPSDGVSARFLTSWPVGQAYALTAMGGAVAGVTLILSNWPK